jgi:hypothetical protein
MIPQEERRITIPENTYLGLEDYAANERKKTKNPLLKEMITPKSLAQKILAMAVKRNAEGRK